MLCKQQIFFKIRVLICKVLRYDEKNIKLDKLGQNYSIKTSSVAQFKTNFK